MKKLIIALFILGSFVTFGGAFMCRNMDTNISSLGIACFFIGIAMIIIGAFANAQCRTSTPTAE